MPTFPERFPANRRRAAFLIVAAIQLASLAACGGGGYGGGGGGNTPVTGVGASKLFVSDSTHTVVGSLANPDPSTGILTVDRLIGPQAPFFYNYVGFTANLGSLALDGTRDVLYVGNGTSVVVLRGASQANGDIFPSATLTSFGATASLFVDTANDRLYVGDTSSVKVVGGASTASGVQAPRAVTGVTAPIFGVAVDTSTKNILYVSDDTVGSSTTHQIMVFDGADAVTNAAPNRTITPTASATNLAVGGIYLDQGNDRLYVAGGSASGTVMVFHAASTANGAIAPDVSLSGFPSGILSVTVDTTNDRLYAIGANGHVFLVEAVSTLNSGAVTAKDASVTGATLKGVAVGP